MFVNLPCSGTPLSRSHSRPPVTVMGCRAAATLARTCRAEALPAE